MRILRLLGSFTRGSDERGKYSGGKAGDQKQDSIFDVKGELSIQDFYVHSKGWRVFRPISSEVADKIANDAEWAANNKNIGYDQGEALRSLLSEFGYTEIEIRKDLAGLDRVAMGRKGAE